MRDTRILMGMPITVEIAHVGLAEMQRLRPLGRTPTPRKISLGARRYLLCPVARDRAYRLSAAASRAWRALFGQNNA